MALFELVLSNKLFTERRRVSLYSNFRKLKESNIDGYEANVAAWKTLLLNAVDQGHFDDMTAISAGPNLLETLYDPDNGRPLALDAVIDELINERVLIPLPTYKSQTSSIYSQGGWLSQVFNPKVVVPWILSYSGIWDSTWKSIGEKKEPGTLKREKYTCMQSLETIGNAIWNKLENEIGITISYTKGVFTKDLLVSLISEVSIPRKTGDGDIKLSRISLSPTDIESVLIYLVRDKSKLISDGQVYKVNMKNASPTITQKDIAIANLRSTIAQTTERVDGLSDQINHCDQKARHALEVYKNKAVAKYALKSKKLAESSQLKALDMLDNLELVLRKIDDATDQADIISALSSGATILGNLNSTIGGAEKVGDLMDKLREQADETDDIGREISSMTCRSVDEYEVEEELDNMLLEEQQKQLNKLKVPTSSANKEEVEENIASLSDDMEEMNISTSKGRILAE